MSWQKRDLQPLSSKKVLELFNDTPRSPLPIDSPSSPSRESTTDSVGRRARGTLNPTSIPTSSLYPPTGNLSGGIGEEKGKSSNRTEVSSLKRSKGSLKDLSLENSTQSDSQTNYTETMRKIQSERDVATKMVESSEIRVRMSTMTHQDHQAYIDRMMKSIAVDAGFFINDDHFNDMSDSQTSLSESWASPSGGSARGNSIKGQASRTSDQRDKSRSSKLAENATSSTKSLLVVDAKRKQGRSSMSKSNAQSERNRSNRADQQDHRGRLPPSGSSRNVTIKVQSERDPFTQSGDNDDECKRSDNYGYRQSDCDSLSSIRKAQPERNLLSLSEETHRDLDGKRDDDRRDKRTQSASSTSVRKVHSEQDILSLSLESSRDFHRKEDGNRHDPRSSSVSSISLTKVKSERNMLPLSKDRDRDFERTRHGDRYDKRSQSGARTTMRKAQSERNLLSSSEGRVFCHDRGQNPRNEKDHRVGRSQSRSSPSRNNVRPDQNSISFFQEHSGRDKSHRVATSAIQHNKLSNTATDRETKKSLRNVSSLPDTMDNQDRDDMIEPKSSFLSRQTSRTSPISPASKNVSVSRNPREERSSSRSRNGGYMPNDSRSNRAEAKTSGNVEYLKSSSSSKFRSYSISPASVGSAKRQSHKTSMVRRRSGSLTSHSAKRKNDPSFGRLSPLSNKPHSRSSSADRRKSTSRSSSSPHRKFAASPSRSSLPKDLPLTHIEISREVRGSNMKSELQNQELSSYSVDSRDRRSSSRYSRQRSSSNESQGGRRRSRSSEKRSSDRNSRQDSRDWESLRKMASTSKSSATERMSLHSVSWHGTSVPRHRRAGRKSELLGSSFHSALEGDQDETNNKSKGRSSSRSQERRTKCRSSERRTSIDDTSVGGGVSRRRLRQMDRAVIVVQKWARRWIAMKKRRWLENEAAENATRVKVQESFRPFKLFLNRLKNDIIYLERVSNATNPIQRLIRGYQSRRKLERLRDEKRQKQEISCLHIQRITRGYLAKLLREREKVRRKVEWQNELAKYEPEKAKYIEYFRMKGNTQATLAHEISVVEPRIAKVLEDYSRECQKIELSREVHRKIWGEVIRKRFEDEEAKKQDEIQAQKRAENDDFDPLNSMLTPEQEIVELEGEIASMKDWLEKTEPKVATKTREWKDLERANLEVEKLFHELNDFARSKVAEKNELSSQQLMLTKMLMPKAVKQANAATLESKKEIRLRLVFRRNLYRVLERLQASDEYDHKLYEEVKRTIQQCEMELEENILEGDQLHELLLGDVDALFEIEAMRLHELGKVPSVPASAAGWGIVAKGVLSNLGKKDKFTLDDLSVDGLS